MFDFFKSLSNVSIALSAFTVSTAIALCSNGMSDGAASAETPALTVIDKANKIDTILFFIKSPPNNSVNV